MSVTRQVEVAAANNGSSSARYRPLSFTEVMRLDEAGQDTFRSHRPAADHRGRTAAQLAAQLVPQAMLAAGRTVLRGRWVHSVHISHVAPGHPEQEIEYQIERVRDSDTASLRLVRARQGATLLALATVSFQAPERGLGMRHQVSLFEASDPYQFQRRDDALASNFNGVAPGATDVPLDVRYVDGFPWANSSTPSARNRFWMRLETELRDELLVHAAALAYGCEFLVSESISRSGQVDWNDLAQGEDLHGRNLDHTIWFHRCFRADDWTFHVHEAPSAMDSRAFAVGRVYSSFGRHIASVSQESLVMPTARA